jgi:hypothetical protein
MSKSLSLWWHVTSVSRVTTLSTLIRLALLDIWHGGPQSPWVTLAHTSVQLLTGLEYL